MFSAQSELGKPNGKTVPPIGIAQSKRFWWFLKLNHYTIGRMGELQSTRTKSHHSLGLVSIVLMGLVYANRMQNCYKSICVQRT